jgi:tetratricopeptide (TPR) repeat protein
VPSYKKSLILCSLLLLFNGCSNKTLDLENKEPSKTKFVEVKTKKFESENQYIILALESENQRMYYDARDLYFDLFDRTNNYEYFAKYLALSTNLKDYELVKRDALKYYVDNIKQEEIILRLYTFALFKLGDSTEALQSGEKLVSLFQNDVNYELLGTIYLQQKNYLKAYEFFEKAFVMNKSANTFLNLTNIQYYNLEQKEQAINKIEEYIKANGYDFNLSMQLLSFYEKEQKFDKLVPFLKEMYFDYKKNSELLMLSKAKILLIKYIAKDSVGKAIEFLEQNNEEDEILLNLYKITNQPQKAYNLLDRLYKKSNNLDFLAQQAIIEFEMAEDKTKVLNDVIFKFDKVLLVTNNHIYENYLAYILIDFNINVKRGVSLVKKALKEEPNNLAYIDTLAWGEYKLKNCQEANKQMKRVVDEVGLNDEEIKLHWEKIKECKK